MSNCQTETAYERVIFITHRAHRSCLACMVRSARSALRLCDWEEYGYYIHALYHSGYRGRLYRIHIAPLISA